MNRLRSKRDGYEDTKEEGEGSDVKGRLRKGNKRRGTKKKRNKRPRERTTRVETKPLVERSPAIKQ